MKGLSGTEEPRYTDGVSSWDEEEQEDEMSMLAERTPVKKRFEPRRAIVLSAEEYAGFEKLMATPQPATPEARAAHAEYLRTVREG